jgi:hypothetical protein
VTSLSFFWTVGRLGWVGQLAASISLLSFSALFLRSSIGDALTPVAEIWRRFAASRAMNNVLRSPLSFRATISVAPTFVIFVCITTKK